MFCTSECIFQIFYEVYQTVDEGRTVLIRAGRINPKYERKGFVKYFEAWLADWRKDNNIEKIAFTASDANPAVTRDTFQLKNKLLLTRVRTWRILGECLLISIVPGKALRTLVDIARLAERFNMLSLSRAC